jgi:KipI family sensor histidine kinase inhibitor
MWLDGGWIRPAFSHFFDGGVVVIEIGMLGDSAIVVRFGDAVDEAVHDHVLALAATLEREPLPGQRDVVPAFASLAVRYDPCVASDVQMPGATHSGARAQELHESTCSMLERLLRERCSRLGAPARDARQRATEHDDPRQQDVDHQDAVQYDAGQHDTRQHDAQRSDSQQHHAWQRHAPSNDARILEIPVCYDRTVAIDIDAIAAHASLSVDEVIALHTAAVYRVYMIGFTPGFPYLGGLDDRLAMPRRATPRERVPAGSVAVGGAQTGIYPDESPGGWWIIGRSPLRLFDPMADPPALLRAGDRVRFRAISAGELAARS